MKSDPAKETIVALRGVLVGLSLLAVACDKTAENCIAFATCSAPLETEAGLPDASGDRVATEAGCTADGDCPQGQLCAADGRCLPGCSDAHGCAGKDVCCDGRCVDTEADPNHCGNCATVCAVANAVPACKQGACTIDHCVSSTLDCDGDFTTGCEAADEGAPTAPEPVGPVIGAYTGSLHAPPSLHALQPTFRWDASTQGCRNTYEIQIEDDCTPPNLQSCPFAQPTVDKKDLTETSFTPDAPLAVNDQRPVGRRYYWRVRACDVVQRCSPWSRTMYVEVGRVEADFNGDGYSDTAAQLTDRSSSSPPKVSIFYGGTTQSNQPDVTVEMQAGINFGQAITFADLDADGYADLVTTDTAADSNSGDMYVYRGGPSVQATGATAAFSAKGSTPGAVLGAAIRGADLNADGYADLLVSGQNRAFEYDGPPATTWMPAITMDQPNVGSGFGATLEAADIDHDGIPNALVAAGADSRVYVYRRDDKPVQAIETASVTSEMIYLARAGDTRRAGFDDLAIAGSMDHIGLVELYLGSTDLRSSVDRTQSADGPMNIAGGFDADGDGLPDFMMASQSSSTATQILFFRGSATGKLEPIHLPIFPNGNVAGAIALLQDGNGDGVGDIVIGTGAATDLAPSALAWYRMSGATPAPVTSYAPSGDYKPGFILAH